LCEQGFQFF